MRFIERRGKLVANYNLLKEIALTATATPGFSKIGEISGQDNCLNVERLLEN
jgi:hypothetical protein